MRKFYFPDTTIGAKLTLDANDGIRSMREFKQQIAEARGDLVTMTEKFGATSSEAQLAAKRVAELTDAMGDAKNLADAFNPDQKFRALSQSLNGVLGGFTAITGAMGLLGIESEGVQKQLLKVQSALALSQGINQVGEAISSFKTLGAQLLNTFGKSGVIGGAVIAGIGAILIAIKNTKSEAEELEEVTRLQYEASKKVVQGFDLEERRLRALGVAEDEIIEKKKQNIIITVKKAEVELKALNAVLEATLKSYAKTAGLRGTAAGNLIADLFFKDEGDLGKVQEEINKVNLELKEFEVILLELDKRQKEIREKKNTGSNDKQKSAIDTLSGVQFDPTTDPVALAEKQKGDYILELRTGYAQEIINSQTLQTEYEEAEARKRVFIAQLEAEGKIQAAQNIATALEGLSDLVGRQTAAGKVFAIASTVISTYMSAQQAFQSQFMPIPTPSSPIRGAIAAAAAIVGGLARVKAIVSTQVPGGGGGSVPSISGAGVQSPLSPQLGFTNTRLDRNQLNQIGNATVRAFVVETDVTNNQERIRRLNRAARI